MGPADEKFPATSQIMPEIRELIKRMLPSAAGLVTDNLLRFL